jgi:hypothetical protein
MFEGLPFTAFFVTFSVLIQGSESGVSSFFVKRCR